MIFGLSYQYEWPNRLFSMLSRKTSNNFSKFDSERVEKFIVIVKDIKRLQSLYEQEYGEKSSKAILTTAYIGLLEIIISLKEGMDLIDNTIKQVDFNDKNLDNNLSEIKSIANAYIGIQKQSNGFNGTELFDYTLDELNQLVNK